MAATACLGLGRPRPMHLLGKFLVKVEKLKWTVQQGEKSLRLDRRPSNFLVMYKDIEVRWEPIGVAAACISWKCVLDLYRNFVGTIYDF